MRATIISICIFCAILAFAIGNTIYINMKGSDLLDLTEKVNEDNLADLAPEIKDQWSKLSLVLRISAVEDKLRTVSRSVSYLYELNNGADLDIRVVKSDLIRALEEVMDLEKPNLLQIF